VLGAARSGQRVPDSAKFWARCVCVYAAPHLLQNDHAHGLDRRDERREEARRDGQLRNGRREGNERILREKQLQERHGDGVRGDERGHDYVRHKGTSSALLRGQVEVLPQHGAWLGGLVHGNYLPPCMDCTAMLAARYVLNETKALSCTSENSPSCWLMKASLDFNRCVSGLEVGPSSSFRRSAV